MLEDLVKLVLFTAFFTVAVAVIFSEFKKLLRGAK